MKCEPVLEFHSLSNRFHTCIHYARLQLSTGFLFCILLLDIKPTKVYSVSQVVNHVFNFFLYVCNFSSLLFTSVMLSCSYRSATRIWVCMSCSLFSSISHSDMSLIMNYVMLE